MSELAEAVMLSPSGLTRLVGRLERDDLVTRRQDASTGCRRRSTGPSAVPGRRSTTPDAQVAALRRDTPREPPQRSQESGGLRAGRGAGISGSGLVLLSPTGRMIGVPACVVSLP